MSSNTLSFQKQVRQALSIAQKTAVLLFEGGKTEEAEVLFRKILLIYIERYGILHNQTLGYILDLSQLLGQANAQQRISNLRNVIMQYAQWLRPEETLLMAGMLNRMQCLFHAPDPKKIATKKYGKTAA